MRLDRAVHARGYARSRSHAQELIALGSVLVDGLVETKASRDVADGDLIELSGPLDSYVSRAAHKLLGALEAFASEGLEVAGKRALDAGASTGGFTQVLLERGVTQVTAVDVGHDQMSPAVAADPRVILIEGLNVRDMEAGSPGSGADVVVADLSFISLAMVLPALRKVAAPHADFLLLVKPQFEVGRGGLDKHGVVVSPAARADAVALVCARAQAEGLSVRGVAQSSLPGSSGNVEFFVWVSESWQARGAAAPRTLSGAGLAAAISSLVEGTP